MMEARLQEDLDTALRAHAGLWATGDYSQIAIRLTTVSAAVVEAAAKGDGLRILVRAHKRSGC